MKNRGWSITVVPTGSCTAVLHGPSKPAPECPCAGTLGGMHHQIADLYHRPNIPTGRTSWRSPHAAPRPQSWTTLRGARSQMDHGPTLPQSPAFYVLGLTGSIGMGKSTVSQMFKSCDIPVLDADEVVHTLYARGGAAVDPVGKVFPSAIVDEAVNRAALSACVVGNEAAMKTLESIVHPLVADQRRQFLSQKRRDGHSLVVLDVPLLYETGLESAVDAVVVVSANPEQQQQRVLARPGMTLDKFKAILARQVADEEKRRRANFLLDTSVSQAETQQQVVALIRELQGKQGRVSANL